MEWLRNIKAHGDGHPRESWELWVYKGGRKLMPKTADTLRLEEAKRPKRGPSDLDEDNHNALEVYQRKIDILLKVPYAKMANQQVNPPPSP